MPLAAEAISDEEIRERMSGNLCRCAAYPNIVRAVAEAADYVETQASGPKPALATKVTP